MTPEEKARRKALIRSLSPGYGDGSEEEFQELVLKDEYQDVLSTEECFNDKEVDL